MFSEKLNIHYDYHFILEYPATKSKFDGTTT